MWLLAAAAETIPPAIEQAGEYSGQLSELLAAVSDLTVLAQCAIGALLAVGFALILAVMSRRWVR